MLTIGAKILNTEGKVFQTNLDNLQCLGEGEGHFFLWKAVVTSPNEL